MNPEQISRLDLCFAPTDHVVVTGAAHGIGRAVALRAAQQGLAVSAWDLNAEGLEALGAEVQETGGRLVSHVGDCSDLATVEAGLAAGISAFGPVSHLMHTASPATGTSLSFDEAITACIGGVRQLTDLWLEGETPSHAAMVVTVSVAGTHFGTGNPWYAAAKAGLAGYVRHLAAFRADEVRSNALAPGLIATPRVAQFADTDLGEQIVARVPVGRMGTADEMAWATLFLLSPMASYVHGTVLVADGGWTIAQ